MLRRAAHVADIMQQDTWRTAQTATCRQGRSTTFNLQQCNNATIREKTAMLEYRWEYPEYRWEYSEYRWEYSEYRREYPEHRWEYSEYRWEYSEYRWSGERTTMR